MITTIAIILSALVVALLFWIIFSGDDDIQPAPPPFKARPFSIDVMGTMLVDADYPGLKELLEVPSAFKLAAEDYFGDTELSDINVRDLIWYVGLLLEERERNEASSD